MRDQTNMPVKVVFRFWKEIVVVFFFFFLVFFLLLFPSTVPPSKKGNISEEVWMWEPVVRELAMKEQIGDQLPLLLAIMMQESGGRAADVMQSSESAGLAVGAITNPVASIAQGIKHWKQMLTLARGLGITDTETIVQSYNYGPGWLYFVKEQGGIGTEELRKKFSMNHAKSENCGWRSPFCYGDYTYSIKVMRYYTSTKQNENRSSQVETILAEARKFEGWPYVWGGDSPDTSFDCSGLMTWIYAKVGIQLPRTAEEQYYYSSRVSETELKPGDLVFFTGTSNHAFISHVGVYVGNGKMYNSNSSGVGYSDLSNPLWKSKIYGYGRVLQGGTK